MNVVIEWNALALVVGVGLLVGGGLPALFALGLRLLTVGAVPADAAAPSARAGSASRVLGYACLAVCVAAIATGLLFLVAGGH